MVKLGPTTDREVIQGILNRAQSYRVGSRARTNLLLDAQIRVALMAIDEEKPTWQPHPALSMPRPKGNLCPVCQHHISAHDATGCYGCDCTMPHGRLIPPAPTPDDISTITEG